MNNSVSNQRTTKKQSIEHAAEQWVNLVLAHITSKRMVKKTDKKDEKFHNRA